MNGTAEPLCDHDWDECGGSDHSRGMCADHGMGTGKRNQIFMSSADIKNMLIRGADRADDRSYPNPSWGMERWMCMEHLRICGGSGHWLFIFPSVKYNNM